MAKRLPELQVLIPYSQLMDLLKASETVDQLSADNKRLHDQLSSLRTQFVELMDAFGELRSFVKD